MSKLPSHPSATSNLAVSETHGWFVNCAAKRGPVSHFGVTVGDMVISPLSLLSFLIFLMRQAGSQRKKPKLSAE